MCKTTVIRQTLPELISKELEERMKTMKRKYEKKKILTAKEWRLTETAFWKLAGEMKASEEFSKSGLYNATQQDSHLVTRAITFMLEAGFIEEVFSPRGVYFKINRKSPFWKLFYGRTSAKCREYWKEATANQGEFDDDNDENINSSE